MKLHVLLTLLCLLAVFSVLRTGIWAGYCTTSAGTFVIDLPPNPAWNPPALPNYAMFASEFDAIPKLASGDFTIERGLRWDLMLLELLFYWLCIFIGQRFFDWSSMFGRPNNAADGG